MGKRTDSTGTGNAGRTRRPKKPTGLHRMRVSKE